MCITNLPPVNTTKHDNLNNERLDLQWGKNYEDNCDYIELDDLSGVSIGNTDISIIQYNIRGILSKNSDFSNFMNTSNRRKFDRCTLSETWLTKTSQN